MRQLPEHLLQRLSDWDQMAIQGPFSSLLILVVCGIILDAQSII